MSLIRRAQSRLPASSPILPLGLSAFLAATACGAPAEDEAFAPEAADGVPGDEIGQARQAAIACSAITGPPTCGLNTIRLNPFPVGGVNGRTYVIPHFDDLDASGGVRDFMGVTGAAAQTMNGHAGLDIGVASFRNMDDGSAVVFAAAGGVVLEATDSFWSRNLVPSGSPNEVTVLHCNRFQTKYLHLKQGSVNVNVGDTIAAGTPIGVVGSSGFSSGPHLHFEMLDCNGGTTTVVDTMTSNLWDAPPAYRPPSDVMDVMVRKATATEPAFTRDQVLDPVPNPTVFGPGHVAHFSASIAGGPGDTAAVEVRRPNGTNLLGTAQTTRALAATRFDQLVFPPPDWSFTVGTDPGTWSLRFFLNGSLRTTRTFTVQPAEFGFLWSSLPTASHDAAAPWSFNSGGGTNRVVRLGTGLYRAEFPNLGSVSNFDAHPQVVAYGTSATRCKLEGWSRTASLAQVNVRCHAPNGTLTDSMFVVGYHRLGSSLTHTGAYLYMNSPSPPLVTPYTATPSLQWSTNGWHNTVTRLSTGRYEVTLRGFSGGGGNVQVTAVGTGSEHCKVGDRSGGFIGDVVTVVCYNNFGGYTDSKFTLQFTRNQTPAPLGTGGWVFANNSSATSYTPTASASFNSAGGANTAGRVAVGTYFVQHSGLPMSSPTSVRVTARGFTPTYCKVRSWDSGTASIGCFDTSGAPVDATFDELYEIAN